MKLLLEGNVRYIQSYISEILFFIEKVNDFQYKIWICDIIHKIIYPLLYLVTMEQL
jgi:hypothetical protein